jgi:membrane-associated phospholipid phosphatase
MRSSTACLAVLAGCLALSCSGCGTLPSGRGWGEDVTVRPGWARVGQAAKDAAADPWVWVPLAGAAAFQIDNLDRRTSDWAREHTPVFGSQHNAENWSDDLRSAAGVMQLVTMLATPSGSERGEWLLNKIKGEAVQIVAISTTGATTEALKDATDRERPNGSDRQSLPSGHTSSAAVHGQLAKINLESIDMSPTLRRICGVTADVVVIGTGWARVEAGWHFPSDTLAGMALGNFFANFFTRAFLADQAHASVALAATDGGAVLEWQARF